MLPLVIVFLAALWAGTQNALAGGGSFLTLPSLMFAGLDARAANITSTLALFPAQIAIGWSGRRYVAGAAGLSFRTLAVISLVGGALGALLLLRTPSHLFAHLLPWLVLFATGLFAYGSFAPRRAGATHMSRAGALCAQFCISVYGGYFGGGIGFLMLAAFTAAGQVVRLAAASKNVLAAVMNASAVAIFVFSPEVHWRLVLLATSGAIIGGLIGSALLLRLNERLLRLFVVLIGTALTVGLFLHAG